MEILILPGNDPRTAIWADDLQQELKFATRKIVHIQRYLHWDDPQKQPINFEREVERLAEFDAEIVIAKSFGVMVGLLAYSKKLIKPKRIIGIGTPVLGFKKLNMDLQGLITKLTIPCLLIQQTNDKVGSFQSLSKAVGNNAILELREIPGDDHIYSDVKLLGELIENWLE